MTPNQGNLDDTGDPAGNAVLSHAVMVQPDFYPCCNIRLPGVLRCPAATVSKLSLSVHVLGLLPLLVVTPVDLQGPGEVHGGSGEGNSYLSSRRELPFLQVAEREKDSPAYVHDRVEVDTNKYKHRPEAIIDHNDNETTNTSGGAVIREMFGCLHCIRYHFIKQVLSWV